MVIEAPSKGTGYALAGPPVPRRGESPCGYLCTPLDHVSQCSTLHKSTRRVKSRYQCSNTNDPVSLLALHIPVLGVCDSLNILKRADHDTCSRHWSVHATARRCARAGRPCPSARAYRGCTSVKTLLIRLYECASLKTILLWMHKIKNSSNMGAHHQKNRAQVSPGWAAVSVGACV